MKNIRKVISGIRMDFKYLKTEGINFKKPDKNKLSCLHELIIHPIETFNDIKYENRGSLLLANIIATLFFLLNLLSVSKTGYLFKTNDSESVHIINVFAYTIGLMLLWSICNWATCTLLDGEGKFKEIWIITAYSLVPWIAIGLVYILITNIFSLDEAVILNIIRTIYQSWTLLLIFLGTIVTHQFTVKKTIASVIVTLIAMVAVCFLMLLFFSITLQVKGFVFSIAKELSYR